MDASWPPVDADSSLSRRAQATVNLVDILRSRCLPSSKIRPSPIAPIVTRHKYAPLPPSPIDTASKSTSAFTIPTDPLPGHIKFRLTGSYNIFEDITPPPYIDNPFAPPAQRHHAVLTRRSKIVSITQCGEFGYAVLCANGLVVFTSSSSSTDAGVYQELNQLIKDKYFHEHTRQTSSAVGDTESLDTMTATQIAALNSSQAHELAQSYQSALQNPLQSHVFTGVVVNSLYHDEFIRSIEYLPTARALYLALTHGIDKGLRVRTVALDDLRSGYVYPAPCRTVTGRDVSQQYTEPYGADEVVVWKTDAEGPDGKPCLSMDCRAAREMHERACTDARIAVDVRARNPSPISLSVANCAEAEGAAEDCLHLSAGTGAVSGQTNCAGTVPAGHNYPQRSAPARARCRVTVRPYGASAASAQLVGAMATQPSTSSSSSYSSSLSFPSSSSYSSSFYYSSRCPNLVPVLAPSDFPAESDLTVARCPCCAREAAACPRLVAALLPHAALDVQLTLLRESADAAIAGDSVHDLSWHRHAWDRTPPAHPHPRTDTSPDANVTPRVVRAVYPPLKRETASSGALADVDRDARPDAYVHLENFSPYHLTTATEGAPSPPRAPLPMPETYYLLECACRVFALRHGHRVRVLQWPWYCVSLARQWEVSDERLAALLVAYADWLDAVVATVPDVVSTPAVLACGSSPGAATPPAWTRANTHLPLWCCPVDATVTLPKYLLPPPSTATTDGSVDMLGSSAGAADEWLEPSLSEAVAVGLGEAVVSAPRIDGARQCYSQPATAAPMARGAGEPRPLPSCCQLHLACALADIPPAAPGAPATPGDAPDAVPSAAVASLASHTPALAAASDAAADLAKNGTAVPTVPPRAKDKRDKAAKKEKKEKKRAAAAAVTDLCYVLHSGCTRYLSRWITLVASMLNTQRPRDQQLVAEVQLAVYARAHTHSPSTAAPLSPAHMGAVQLAPSLFRAICQHWLDMRFLLSLTALPPLLALPPHLLIHIGRYYALFYPAHCGAPGYTISADTPADAAESRAEGEGIVTDICVGACPHVDVDTPGAERVAPTGSTCTASPSSSSSSGSLPSSLAAPTLALRDIYSFKRNVPDENPPTHPSAMPAGSISATLRPSAYTREITVTTLPESAPLCRRLLALNVDVEVAFAEDVHRAQQEARTAAMDAAGDGSSASDASRTPSSSTLPPGVSPAAFPSILPPLNHAPLPVTPAVFRDTVIPSLLWRLTAREEDAPLESVVKLWPVHDADNDIAVEGCGARTALHLPPSGGDTSRMGNARASPSAPPHLPLSAAAVGDVEVGRPLCAPLSHKHSSLAPQAALELLAALQQPSLDLALSLGGVSLLRGADTGRCLSDAGGHAGAQSASVAATADVGAVLCGTAAEEYGFEDMFLCYLHAAASNVALASVIERKTTRPPACAASPPCPPLPPHTPIVSVAVVATARADRTPDATASSPFSPKRARVASLASQQSSDTAAATTVSLSELPSHGSGESVPALATTPGTTATRRRATSPSPAAARTLALDTLPFLPRLVARQLHQRFATPQKRECPSARAAAPATADTVDDASAGAADALATKALAAVSATHPTPPRRNQPQFPSSSSSFSLAFSPPRAVQASCLTPCADAKRSSVAPASTTDSSSASLLPPLPTHTPLPTLRPLLAPQSTPQLLSPASTPNKRLKARVRVNTPSHATNVAAAAVETTPLPTARTPQHVRTPRPNTGTPRQRRATPRSMLMMLGSVPAKPVKVCVSQQKSGGKAGSARKLLGLGEDKAKMLKRIPKLVLDRADAAADAPSDAAHVADTDGALCYDVAAATAAARVSTPLRGAIDDAGAECFAGAFAPLVAEASGPCCTLAAFLFIPALPAWTLLPVAMLIAHRRMHRTRVLLREQLFRSMFAAITAKSWVSRARYLALPELLESLPTLPAHVLRDLLDSPAALRNLHTRTDAPAQSLLPAPALTLSRVRFPAPLQSHVPLWTLFSYRGREVADVSVHHRRVFVFSSSQTHVDARLPHSLRNHCPWTTKDCTAATLAAAGCIQKAQLQLDGTVRPLAALRGGAHHSWDDVLACGGQPAPEPDVAAGGHACLRKDWIFVGKDAALGKIPVSGAIFLGPLAYPNELTCDVTTLCLDSSVCLSAFTLSSRLLEVVAHAHVLERKLAQLLAHDLPHSHDQLFPFSLPARAHHTHTFAAPPTSSAETSTPASSPPTTSSAQGAAARQHHASLAVSVKSAANLLPPVPAVPRTIPLLMAPQVLCDARCCTLCYTSACVQPQSPVNGPPVCIDHATHACSAQPAACGHHCTVPAQLAFEQAFSTAHAVYVKMTGFPLLAIPVTHPSHAHSHTRLSAAVHDTPAALAADSSAPLPAFQVLPHTSSLGANASAAATLDTLLIRAHSGSGTHADLYTLPASALRDVRFDALFPSPPLVLSQPTSGTAAPVESVSVGVVLAAADKAGRTLCTLPLADQAHLLGPAEVALHTLHAQPLPARHPRLSSSPPPAPRAARSHATVTLTAAAPRIDAPACWSPTTCNTSDPKAAAAVSLEECVPPSSDASGPLHHPDSPHVTARSRPSTQSRARPQPLPPLPSPLISASHIPAPAASLSAVSALPRATPATRTPRAARTSLPLARTPRAHSATPLPHTLRAPHSPLALAAAESATPAHLDARAHTNAGIAASMHTAGAAPARHGTAPSTPLLSLAHRPTPRRAFAQYMPRAHAAALGAAGEGADMLVGVSTLGAIPEDALREVAEVAEGRGREVEDADEQPWATARSLYWEMQGAGPRASVRPLSSSTASSSARPVSVSPTLVHHTPRSPQLSHLSPRPRPQSRTDVGTTYQHFRVPPTPSSALTRAAVSPLPLRTTSPLLARPHASPRGHLPGTPTLPRRPSRPTSPALARPPLRPPSLFPPLPHTTPTHTVVLPLARPSPFHAAHANSASTTEPQGDKRARTHTPLLRPKRTRMGLAEMLTSSSSDPMSTPTAASPPVVFPPLAQLTRASGSGSPGAPSPLLAPATARAHRPQSAHTSALGASGASTSGDLMETAAAAVTSATAPLDVLDAAQDLPSPKRMRVADDVDGHAQARPCPPVHTPTDVSTMPRVPATPTSATRPLPPTSSPASPLCHSRYARAARVHSPSSHALPSAPQLPSQFDDLRTATADTRRSLSSAFSALPRALSPSQGYISQPLPDADALAGQHVEWALPALPKPRVPPEQWSPRLTALRPRVVDGQPGLGGADTAYSPSSPSSSSSSSSSFSSSSSSRSSLSRPSSARAAVSTPFTLPSARALTPGSARPRPPATADEPAVRLSFSPRILSTPSNPHLAHTHTPRMPRHSSARRASPPPRSGVDIDTETLSPRPFTPRVGRRARATPSSARTNARVVPTPSYTDTAHILATPAPLTATAFGAQPHASTVLSGAPVAAPTPTRDMNALGALLEPVLDVISNARPYTAPHAVDVPLTTTSSLPASSAAPPSSPHPTRALVLSPPSLPPTPVLASPASSPASSPTASSRALSPSRPHAPDCMPTPTLSPCAEDHMHTAPTTAALTLFPAHATHAADASEDAVSLAVAADQNYIHTSVPALARPSLREPVLSPMVHCVDGARAQVAIYRPCTSLSSWGLIAHTHMHTHPHPHMATHPLNSPSVHHAQLSAVFLHSLASAAAVSSSAGVDVSLALMRTFDWCLPANMLPSHRAAHWTYFLQLLQQRTRVELRDMVRQLCTQAMHILGAPHLPPDVHARGGLGGSHTSTPDAATAASAPRHLGAYSPSAQPPPLPRLTDSALRRASEALVSALSNTSNSFALLSQDPHAFVTSLMGYVDVCDLRTGLVLHRVLPESLRPLYTVSARPFAAPPCARHGAPVTARVTHPARANVPAAPVRGGDPPICVKLVPAQPPAESAFPATSSANTTEKHVNLSLAAFTRAAPQEEVQLDELHAAAMAQEREEERALLNRRCCLRRYGLDAAGEFLWPVPAGAGATGYGDVRPREKYDLSLLLPSAASFALNCQAEADVPRPGQSSMSFRHATHPAASPLSVECRLCELLAGKHSRPADFSVSTGSMYTAVPRVTRIDGDYDVPSTSYSLATLVSTAMRTYTQRAFSAPGGPITSLAVSPDTSSSLLTLATTWRAPPLLRRLHAPSLPVSVSAPAVAPFDPRTLTTLCSRLRISTAALATALQRATLLPSALTAPRYLAQPGPQRRMGVDESVFARAFAVWCAWAGIDVAVDAAAPSCSLCAAEGADGAKRPTATYSSFPIAFVPDHVLTAIVTVNYDARAQELLLGNSYGLLFQVSAEEVDSVTPFDV